MPIDSRASKTDGRHLNAILAKSVSSTRTASQRSRNPKRRSARKIIKNRWLDVSALGDLFEPVSGKPVEKSFGHSKTAKITFGYPSRSCTSSYQLAFILVRGHEFCQGDSVLMVQRGLLVELICPQGGVAGTGARPIRKDCRRWIIGLL